MFIAFLGERRTNDGDCRTRLRLWILPFPPDVFPDVLGNSVEIILIASLPHYFWRGIPNMTTYVASQYVHTCILCNMFVSWCRFLIICLVVCICHCFVKQIAFLVVCAVYVVHGSLSTCKRCGRSSFCVP